MKIAVPDTFLAVEEQGCGKPVVLVHGGTGTGAYDWELVLPTLARYFRTVTLDLRGHGGSPAPGFRLGIVRFGLDVAHVMRSLGISRALLVGFSAGANSLLTLGHAATLVARRPGDGRRVDDLRPGAGTGDPHGARGPRKLAALRHYAATGPGPLDAASGRHSPKTGWRTTASPPTSWHASPAPPW
ncbi:MAG: hypothetical protein KatS3mg011_2387 [Acidimicrobiia bacterium]|nr:MAG: hypothetical protein KatS3mg011_2387 [Acidimicrobiia bacterium]